MKSLASMSNEITFRSALLDVNRRVLTTGTVAISIGFRTAACANALAAFRFCMFPFRKPLCNQIPRGSGIDPMIAVMAVA